MIKTLTNLFKQDKEKFVVPKGVQDVIPVAAIFDDGIFKVGKDKYSKTYRFTDINYAVASREDKEAKRAYAESVAAGSRSAQSRFSLIHMAFLKAGLTGNENPKKCGLPAQDSFWPLPPQRF